MGILIKNMDQRAAHKELSKDAQDLERMIRKNEFEQKQAEARVQQMVKAGKSKAEIRPYAKNVLTLRQNNEKLMANRNKFTNARFQVDQMYANQKMVDQMGKMNNVMKKATGNVDINKIAKTAQEMNMNMEKMNVCTELIDDAMGEMEDNDSNVNALLDGIQDKVDNKHKQQFGGTNLVSDDQVKDQFQKMLKEAGL